MLVNSLTRRLTSLIAAFALVQATASPVSNACERSHGGTRVAAAVTEGAGHSAHRGPNDTDCAGTESGVPQSTEHGRDCLSSCVSMMGCSAFGFVGESMLSAITERSTSTPTLAVAAHPWRELAPDHPPPRV